MTNPSRALVVLALVALFVTVASAWRNGREGDSKCLTPTSSSDMVPTLGDIVQLSSSVPMSTRYWNNAAFESDIAVHPSNPLAIVSVSGSFAIQPPCVFNTAINRTKCTFTNAPTVSASFNFVTSTGYSGVFQSQHSALTATVAETRGDDEVDVGPAPVPNSPGHFTYANNQTRFYHAMLANTLGPLTTGSPQLAIEYSDDNGNTWSPLALIQPPTNVIDINDYFLDRDTMCVDTDTHSPYFGSVYVVILAFSNTDPFLYEILLYSRDGGVSWGVTIMTVCDGDCYNSVSNPFLGCAATKGGKLNVVMSSDNGVQLVQSNDGGLSFGEVSNLVQWTNVETVLLGTAAQALAYPGVAPRTMAGVNAVIVSSHQNDLYIVFNQCIETMPGSPVHCAVQLLQSHNGGRTWVRSALVDIPGYSTGMPAVTTSSDGTRIVVLFYLFNKEFPLGTPTNIYNNVQATVSYVFSLDGGNTFTTPSAASNVFDPNVALRRNFENFGFFGDYNNAVIDNEGNAHLTWTDTSLGTPCQPYWDFANGVTGTPFDLFVACPLNTTGRSDVFYRKVTFGPDTTAASSPV
jgi:hypothetical protein